MDIVCNIINAIDISISISIVSTVFRGVQNSGGSGSSLNFLLSCFFSKLR